MLFCNQIRGMNQASMLAPKLDIEGCISYLKMCEPSHPMEVCKDLGQGIMAVRQRERSVKIRRESNSHDGMYQRQTKSEVNVLSARAVDFRRSKDHQRRSARAGKCKVEKVSESVAGGYRGVRRVTIKADYRKDITVTTFKEYMQAFILSVSKGHPLHIEAMDPQYNYIGVTFKDGGLYLRKLEIVLAETRVLL